MVSKVITAVFTGVEGHLVTVEIDLSRGLPSTDIVGLASTTVMEARGRVKAAIVNSGMEYPMTRITINLTPASIRKNGTHMDLPIAVGIIASAGKIKMRNLAKYAIIGELALDGSVHRVDGVLPMVSELKTQGVEKIIVPIDNRREASLVEGVEVYGVVNLNECIELINGIYVASPYDDRNCSEGTEDESLDFGDIRGQENAKRAITIAVAGRHGLIMIGNPGCGKTMLARRIPTIMPPMTTQEIIDTSVVYSVLGKINPDQGAIRMRPFRNPHSSISRAALLGGGNTPVPGEITLAHNGVLFLDEVCEFDRNTLEALRTPLEEKNIRILRHGQLYSFPCNFMMVMAANPCKCGYYGDSKHECTCGIGDLAAYRRKLSGPLMERVDMQFSMERVEYDEIDNVDYPSITSEMMKADVDRAINFAASQGRLQPNSSIGDMEAYDSARLGEAEKQFLNMAYEQLGLSPRVLFKIVKVARTIADIEESDSVRVVHLSEALSYRSAVESMHA